MDWWLFNPEFNSKAWQPAEDELAALKARIVKLEARPPGPRTPPTTHKNDAYGPCAGAVGKAGPRGDS